MANKNSISFEIPLPWATRPMRIRADGLHAVVAAAIVAIAIVLVVRFG